MKLAIGIEKSHCLSSQGLGSDCEGWIFLSHPHINNGVFFLFTIDCQSARKRRITRIGTHVFPLGRMIFARRESRVRMFF